MRFSRSPSPREAGGGPGWGAIIVIALAALTGVRAEDAPPEGYERIVTPDLVVDRRPRDAVLARGAMALFAESRGVVEARLGAKLGDPPPRLVLTSSDADFRERHLELAGTPPASWALAIAVPSKRVMVLRADRLAAGNDFLEPTLRHELAHLVLGAVARRSGHALPRWLDEGLAMYAENAAFTRSDELELGAAASAGTLETFASLERNFPPHAPQAERAYKMSLGFVLWLDRKPGGAHAIVAKIDAGARPEDAVREVAGEPAGEAEAEWKLDLAARSSVFESLVRSSTFWWGMVSVLALLAFLRQAILTRRLRKKMERAEMLEQAPHPDPPPASPGEGR